MWVNPISTNTLTTFQPLYAFFSSKYVEIILLNFLGAFLIPYVLSLFLMGIPVFYMELAVGQRFRKSPLHIWNKLSPSLAGVGLSSVVVAFLVGCYYNMIVAWCFYYLFISFQAEVPYTKCPCIEGFSSCDNATFGMVKECALSSPTTYFWYREALNTSSSIDDSGVFNWKLCLCLLLSWIIIFAITSKGAESIGKVYIELIKRAFKKDKAL